MLKILALDGEREGDEGGAGSLKGEDEDFGDNKASVRVNDVILVEADRRRRSAQGMGGIMVAPG